MRALRSGTWKCHQRRVSFSAAAHRKRGCLHRCRATDQDSGGGGKQSPGVSEDVLAKLRAFEEENKRLKDRLKDKVLFRADYLHRCDVRLPLALAVGKPTRAPTSQACTFALRKSTARTQEALRGELAEPQEARRQGRIDGTGLQRETIFGSSKTKGNWLSEGDIDFFTGSARHIVHVLPTPRVMHVDCMEARIAPVCTFFCIPAIVALTRCPCLTSVAVSRTEKQAMLRSVVACPQSERCTSTCAIARHVRRPARRAGERQRPDEPRRAGDRHEAPADWRGRDRRRRCVCARADRGPQRRRLKACLLLPSAAAALDRAPCQPLHVACACSAPPCAPLLVHKGAADRVVAPARRRCAGSVV
jgi:hypothetical protein